MGVTGTLGFSISNFDVQASYTMGLAESDPVHWYAKETNVEQEVDTYKLNTISVKLGYQFALSMRVGLTPQIGYMTQTLSSSGQYGDGANCGSFTVGAKLLIAPVPHLCLVLGAMGIANMWVAIFADVGVMVIAVLNAVRALSTKGL